MARNMYLKPPVPFPRNTAPPYTPDFAETFDPLLDQANDQAAESDAATQNNRRGAMNFWGLFHPFASASFRGRPLFPNQAAAAPRNEGGFRTNIFGQPYGQSTQQEAVARHAVNPTETPAQQWQRQNPGQPLVTGPNMAPGAAAPPPNQDRLLRYLTDFFGRKANRGNWTGRSQI